MGKRSQRSVKPTKKKGGGKMGLLAAANRITLLQGMGNQVGRELQLLGNGGGGVGRTRVNRIGALSPERGENVRE